MKYRYAGFKAQDAKLSQITIRKWRESFYCVDKAIGYIADKQQKIDEKYRAKGENDGSPSPYVKGPKQFKLPVFFGPKAVANLTDQAKGITPKYPVEFIVSDVYYAIVDGKLFINFMSDIKLKDVTIGRTEELKAQDAIDYEKFREIMIREFEALGYTFKKDNPFDAILFRKKQDKNTIHQIVYTRAFNTVIKREFEQLIKFTNAELKILDMLDVELSDEQKEETGQEITDWLNDEK